MVYLHYVNPAATKRILKFRKQKSPKHNSENCKVSTFSTEYLYPNPCPKRCDHAQDDLQQPKGPVPGTIQPPRKFRSAKAQSYQKNLLFVLLANTRPQALDLPLVAHLLKRLTIVNPSSIPLICFESPTTQKCPSQGPESHSFKM